MIYGIDCATPLTDELIVLIKNEGYQFVGRYVVPETPALKWKALTRAEAERISNAGLYLFSIYETTGKEAVGGKRSGIYHAEKAIARAADLGIPEYSAIYFAVDYEPLGDQQLQDVYDFFTGVYDTMRYSSNHYLPGVYGCYRVVTKVAEFIPYLWQCAAWSYKLKSAHVDMYQSIETTLSDYKNVLHVDINEARSIENVGAWKIEKETEKDPKIPTWYEPFRYWVSNNGIADGTRPEDPATRAEVWAMLKRLYDKFGVDTE